MILQLSQHIFYKTGKHVHTIHILYAAGTFISAVFMMSPNWMPPKCPTRVEWIKNTVEMFMYWISIQNNEGEQTFYMKQH